MAAPELLRHALAAGLDVGVQTDGACYAQITNRRSRAQRAVFEAMTANPFVPDVVWGSYYHGDFRRMQ